MKTTLDLPDRLLRQVKARAAREGRPMRALVAEALTEKLRRPAADAADATVPAWRQSFGALREHRDALREIDAVIEREFETVNPEDWR